MVAVAVILGALQISYSIWQKIPAKDKARIKKAIVDRNIALAKSIVQKYRKGNPQKKNNPCRVHCSVCGAISPKGYNFAKRMKWLRTHRKRSHGKKPKQKK